MAGRVALLALTLFACDHIAFVSCSPAYAPNPIGHSVKLDEFGQESNANCYPEKVGSSQSSDDVCCISSQSFQRVPKVSHVFIDCASKQGAWPSSS